MSALARYFHANGKFVGGYDRISTPLTKELSALGISIHHDDNTSSIPKEFTDKDTTLIVRTPAVPAEHKELNYFTDNGFIIMKRARVLGLIFNAHKGIAIAGTHGKTSVGTLTSYLLREAGIDCSSFLGGISKNYDTNLLIGKSEYVVAEADEFDRSFLQLHPYISLVTTVDADHLDIYRDFEDLKDTFSLFVSQTLPGGTIILKEGIDIPIPEGRKKLTYSYDNPEADFFASDINIENGNYRFSINTPVDKYEGFQIQVPGKTNIENTIAAVAICFTLGAEINKLQQPLYNYKGVRRRFDIQYKSSSIIYVDDYAHHPRELDAIISSMRDLYKGKKLTGIFQPHLYTRTRDFCDEFANSLSKFDELILLDIYPAREKPLPGVTSDILFDKIEGITKHRCSKENLLFMLKDLNIEVLLTVGAGDIDQLVEPIKDFLKN